MPESPVKRTSTNSDIEIVDQSQSQSRVSTFFRSIFGYRKTSLTLFAFLVALITITISLYDDNLELTVGLPDLKAEQDILNYSWFGLQTIGSKPHPYGSKENDAVRKFILDEVKASARKQNYIEVDSDANNSILYGLPTNSSSSSVHYYESNNILVRINGSDNSLPALLVSAHFDSVPTAYGITDDGMGIASMLGLVKAYSMNHFDQPKRTIILNFNNNEEFGLDGARAFLNHPWSETVNYFLNLEGTGAGGKCVLFRGTDFGIAKYFNNVRYPFATSIYQMGFNNHLIHSETDYKIYKENGGFRGLDLAFYKPRDLYHTAGDNIKNITPKSLWHMLSNTLDFVSSFTENGEIDLDNDKRSSEDSNISYSTAVYSSFLNYFFIVPASKIVIINLVLLILLPLISLPFFIGVIFKSNWKITCVNILKFPSSFFLSNSLIRVITSMVSSWNEFIANSHPFTLLATYVALLLLLNYFILNSINLIFRNSKTLNHDEKLIFIIEISFIMWIALLYYTVVMLSGKMDASGSFALTLIYPLQAAAGFVGLFGWFFTPAPKYNKVTIIHEDEENEPLIGQSSESNYGSNDSPADEVVDHNSVSSTISLSSSLIDGTKKYEKSPSYGWWIQFFLFVPIPFFLTFNTGSIILQGINKTLQESLIAEKFIYNVICLIATTLTLVLLPFIFKINRFGILVLALIICNGIYVITFNDAFDIGNPLKLRFIQKIESTASSSSTVEVYGRQNSGIIDILSDLPSVKRDKESVTCDLKNDGMQICSFNTTSSPNVIPKGSDYIVVDILRNSSNNGIPFGLLTGEIEIKSPESRLCDLRFSVNSAEDTTRHVSSPVKTVIVYKENASNSSKSGEYPDVNGIPKGFSKDKDGNFIYKDLEGISELKLNKLDWQKPFHVAFQWIPNFISQQASSKDKLKIEVDCYWADLSNSAVPIYSEFLTESPNYVSWSNLDKGLVTAKVELEV